MSSHSPFVTPTWHGEEFFCGEMQVKRGLMLSLSKRTQKGKVSDSLCKQSYSRTNTVEQKFFLNWNIFKRTFGKQSHCIYRPSSFSFNIPTFLRSQTKGLLGRWYLWCYIEWKYYENDPRCPARGLAVDAIDGVRVYMRARGPSSDQASYQSSTERLLCAGYSFVLCGFNHTWMEKNSSTNSTQEAENVTIMV